MRLRSFQIKDCFGFRDSGRVELEDPRNFIYILGRNSSGKTSFLTALAHFAPNLIPQTHPNFTNFNPSSGIPYLIGEYHVSDSKGFSKNAFLQAFATTMTSQNNSDPGVINSLEYKMLIEDLVKGLSSIYESLFDGILEQDELCVRRSALGTYQFSLDLRFEDARRRVKRHLPELLDNAARMRGIDIQGNDWRIFVGAGWRPMHHLTPEEIENLLADQLPTVAWFNQAYPLLDTLPKILKHEHVQSSDPLTNAFMEYLGREDVVQLLTIEDPFEQDDILKKLQEKVQMLMGKVNQSSLKGKELLAMRLSRADGLQVTMLTAKKRSFYQHLSDNTKFLFAYHLYQEVHNLNGKILLFDEPNNGFHATAQDQLLIFLNTLAEKGNLVIVSTHSEHMIDPDRLTGIRLMSADSKGTLHIRNKWYGQTEERYDVQAIRPILDAIGLRYGANKLTIRDKVIITEGVTELLYLRALHRLLDYKGELHLAPGTGDKKIKPLVALIISQGLRFKVLIDTTRGRRSTKMELRDEYGIPDAAICEVEVPAQFPLAKGSGIEDIFSKADFAQLLMSTGHTLLDDFETLANSEYMKKPDIVPKRVVAHEFYMRVTNMHIDDETEKNARRLLDFCVDDTTWFLAFENFEFRVRQVARETMLRS